MSRGGSSEDVILNVYDLNEANQYLHPAGFGLYHSGVQIGGKEYTFAGGGGIFTHEPKEAPGAQFRCSVNMGKVLGGKGAVDDAVISLREDFGPNNYNLLTRNCNSFSDAFCQVLLNKPIPGWVNRVAYIGSWIGCLLPPQMLSDSPVSDNAATTSNTMTIKNEHASNYNAFSGKGMCVGTNTQSTLDSGNLTDRREKVRLARVAALNR